MGSVGISVKVAVKGRIRRYLAHMMRQAFDSIRTSCMPKECSVILFEVMARR